ncbi:MAG: hypothetical protein ACREMP_03780 [Candidatus Tyrphobacter sp.]
MAPPTAGSQGPTHVQNWLYACVDANQTCTQPFNVGISATWMASHVDWNEVYYDGSQDGTSVQLAAAGAKHIVAYLDPNIATYCPVPGGYSVASPDFPENGTNCSGVISRFLHSENGSYAHAYQHQGNGDRLFDHADGLYGGQAQEPFFIGDPDLQAAFHAATLADPYATDVFDDDGGGSYNCIADDGFCSGTYGAAHYAPPACGDGGGYWCYKYGETAIEWDAAPNPQQAYANDAIDLANASSKPVMGNDGVGTDAYDLQWVRDANVEGAMSEHTWISVSNPTAWIERADDIMTYHAMGKFVVEEDGDASRLMFQIASHWIVYDPVYSIEFLAEVNGASQTAGGSDTTFPAQSIVPSNPLVATPPTSDVTVFAVQPGLFVREYATCYQAGAPIGYCAAVVNATGSAMPLSGLTRSYSRALVHNASATWAAGGRPLWGAAPTTIPANSGLILAQ